MAYIDTELASGDFLQPGFTLVISLDTDTAQFMVFCFKKGCYFAGKSPFPTAF